MRNKMMDFGKNKDNKMFNKNVHKGDKMAKVINRQLKIPIDNFHKDLGNNVNPFKDLSVSSEETISLNISNIDTDKMTDEFESFY